MISTPEVKHKTIIKIMTKTRLILLVIIISSLAALNGCGGSEKSRIAETMRVYVEPTLAEGESFNFVGLSNRRDTLFMGETRPCAMVIYTIVENSSDDAACRCDEVIFSNDYKSLLSVEELDFDPIEMVRVKVKEELKKRIHEKIGK